MYKERTEKSMGDGIAKILRVKSITFLVIGFIIGVVLTVVIGTGVWKQQKQEQVHTEATERKQINDKKKSDKTIGQKNVPYVVSVDFANVITGESERHKKLEVMTQKVSVSHTETKNGLFNWGVFSQAKAMVFHGIGRYTVDFTKMREEDFSVDEKMQKITIRIPAPEFSVDILPEETELFDTANGILRFGEMQLTPEIMKEIEIMGKEKLYEELKNDETVNEQARWCAKMSVQEIYQPLVTAKINEAVKEKDDEYAKPVYYTVEVEIDDTK